MRPRRNRAGCSNCACAAGRGKTFTTLGLQAAGEWGFRGGVNEHYVALGQTTIQTRLADPHAGLSGSDIVRLTLQRCSCARQAVDCVTDLVTRHGQGDGGRDHAFLIADAGEAYVVETAGPHWAVQEIGAVRAVSDICLLRQDWDRLSHGLCDLAVDRKWWPLNGSKLDFAGVVAPEAGDHAAALRRWGQATLFLEQQSGRIDMGYLRWLLGNHSESAVDSKALNAYAMERSLCRYPVDDSGPATAASLVVEMTSPELAALAWCAFGPPGLSVYFPVFLDAELPPALTAASPATGCEMWQRLKQLSVQRDDASWREALRQELTALQAHFDQQTKEALTEAAAMKKEGDTALQRLLGTFMQANIERFEEFWSTQVEPRPPAGSVRSSVMVAESVEIAS